MTIRPVDFNGMLQRTDDVSHLKHQEDSKPLVDQQNIQHSVEQKSDALRHQVTNPDDSTQADTHADAREEGKGTYFDSRRKKDKDKKKEQDGGGDGRIIKRMPESSFDIKI